MRSSQSLKGKLLLTVGLLTLLGYVFIVLLVSSRYSKSLESALEAQGSILAQTLAVQLTDLVLINDITAIQKLLDSLVAQHNLSYAFLVRSSHVLAHTFEGDGVPQELFQFNLPEKAGERALCSTKQFRFAGSNEVIVDIACPIYEGKAGFVHLGVSKKHIHEQLVELWVQTALATLTVLLVTLGGVFLLLKRLTRPLETLVGITQQVGKGQQGAELKQAFKEISGHDEITELAVSFQEMLERLNEKTRKVARSNEQLLLCNTIITGVAAQKNLQEMGRFLLTQCRGILHCADIALLFFDLRYNSLLSVSTDKVETITGHDHLQKTLSAAQILEAEKTLERLEPPLVPERFAAYEGQMHIPILYENKVCGLFISGCIPGCRCDRGEIALISLVLGQVAGCLYRALEYEDEVKKLQERFEQKDNFHGMVGHDNKMQLLFKRVEDVASSDASVLIQGESGTGKELVAKAIHTLSPRAQQPFVVINCAAYQDTLLESELFGHEKGAFTGADKQRIGRFEQANGGTVFLDEIGDISLSAQVKLLRVLQEKVIERVGGNKIIPVNVRIVAATNRQLAEAIKTGAFREDLYYRLDVVSLTLPPLRERTGDVLLLTNYFLHRFSAEYNKTLTINPAAMQVLAHYHWPGNVRELENCLAQAALLATTGVITPYELPGRITNTQATGKLEQNEREVIVRILAAAQGNKKITAAQLGISRTTLYAKMKKLNIPSV